MDMRYSDCTRDIRKKVSGYSDGGADLRTVESEMYFDPGNVCEKAQKLSKGIKKENPYHDTFCFVVLVL
jgi:hypothetical protein